MITEATITRQGEVPEEFEPAGKWHGMKDYVMDAWDLLDFGRCPQRWVRTPAPEEPPKTTSDELVRWMHLRPDLTPGKFTMRPETYTAMKRICPRCGSTGPGATCRACKVQRVVRPEERPWSKAATTCAEWEQEREKRGLKIVSPADWERAQGAAQALEKDPDARELWVASERGFVVEGTWHDAETGLDIPVRGLVDYVAREDGPWAGTMGTLLVGRDISPGVWLQKAYARGHHVVAALKRVLLSAASPGSADAMVWVAVEREAPWIVGRRRAAPDLMTRGSNTVSALLAAYARCLASNTWPVFDGSKPGSLDGFSECSVEPWMTANEGGSDPYFAVGASAGLATP